MKKLISLILVLCLMFSLCISVSAVSNKEANITYRAISLVLNGNVITPCDAAGNTVEPFIMGGTTYLPLRAVAQALGLNVKWIPETNTVELTGGGEVKTGAGEPGSTRETKSVSITYRDIKVFLDGAELKLVNAAGDTVEPFILDGSTFLPLRVIGEALGLNINWDAATSTVSMIMPEPDYSDGRWLVSKSTETYNYSDGWSYNWVYTYEYDEYGYPVVERGESSNGSWFEHLADPENNWYRNEDHIIGGTATVEEMQYDYFGGNLLSYYFSDARGYEEKNVCSYDSEGVLIKEEFSCENTWDGSWYPDTMSYVSTHSYKGDVRHTVTVYGDGYRDEYTTTYFYDDQGDLIKEVEDHSGYISTLEYISTENSHTTKWYDSEGNFWTDYWEWNENDVITLSSYEDNETSQRYVYTYTDAPDVVFDVYTLVSEEYYDDVSGYWSRIDYHYDENGFNCGHRFEDEAGYKDIVYHLDANSFIDYVTVEINGVTYTYDVTCDKYGNPIRVEGEGEYESIVYTYEYVFLSWK